ncbi:MAG TPA: zinc dependent phospholipase C family protein [Polyangia bacterium]|jgi:hypothetical protein
MRRRLVLGLLLAVTFSAAPARALGPLGHSLVAARVLDEAAQHPERYPAEIARIAKDPALRAFFLGGAVAPDLITARGASLAPQVHRGLPGAWAMALLLRAQTPEERAYALGWVTHYAADRVAHPYMIARGLEQDFRAPAHVTFETALDVIAAHWAKDQQAAALVGGHRHALELLGRALAEIEGAAAPVTVAPLCGLKVVGAAVHLDGAALAKCGLLGKVKVGVKVGDPGGVLAAVARAAGKRGATDPAALKLAPEKEVTHLYVSARARAHELLTFASRGEWDALNRDLESGGAPAAKFRPAATAAPGFYYALTGAAEDRGREPELMRQLTRRGHGSVLLCRGLPPKSGGVIRVVPPPRAGQTAPTGAEFTPVCIGPYGSREQALKTLVDLKEAANAAFREATGRPSPGLVVDEPRYAF